jgi:hypothetical protein
MGAVLMTCLSGLAGCGSIDEQASRRAAVEIRRQRERGIAEGEGTIPAEAEEVRYSNGRGLFLRIDPQSRTAQERHAYAVITRGHWTPDGILIPAERILPLCDLAAIPKAACEHYHATLYGGDYLHKPRIGSPAENRAKLEAALRYQCLDGPRPPLTPSDRAIYGPDHRPPKKGNPSVDPSVCRLVRRAAKKGGPIITEGRR